MPEEFHPLTELTVTFYLDTDEDAVVNAKLSQLLKYAKELGFIPPDDVELENAEVQ